MSTGGLCSTRPHLRRNLRAGTGLSPVPRSSSRVKALLRVHTNKNTEQQNQPAPRTTSSNDTACRSARWPCHFGPCSHKHPPTRLSAARTQSLTQARVYRLTGRATTQDGSVRRGCVDRACGYFPDVPAASSERLVRLGLQPNPAFRANAAHRRQKCRPGSCISRVGPSLDARWVSAAWLCIESRCWITDVPAASSERWSALSSPTLAFRAFLWLEEVRGRPLYFAAGASHDTEDGSVRRKHCGSSDADVRPERASFVIAGSPASGSSHTCLSL